MAWRKCSGVVPLWWTKSCSLGVLRLRASNVGFHPVLSSSATHTCHNKPTRLLATTTTKFSSLGTLEFGKREDNSNKKESGAYMTKGASIVGIGALLLGYYQYRKHCRVIERQNHADLRDQESTNSSLLSVLSNHFFMPVYCVQDGGHHGRSKQFNFLAEAVEIVAPSVVYIEKQEKIGTFFGSAMVMSSGSGFIVEDGTYVVTNAHVVGSAREVKVKLISGRVLTGEVTDIDQIADLALVKLNLPSGEKLPALKFGSSGDVRPGEWVVAVGSPLSLENTITAGIVSSVHRPSKELGLHRYGKPDSMGYLQTDAAITIGNSGGPLVNLDGEVIGVNNMTAGPGISFAIPSDFAHDFVKNASKTVQKKQSRSGNRYAIGISMLSLTPNVLRTIRSTLSLPSDVTHGVLVATVWPNGAAAQAGLKRGDVIVRVNGKNIESCRELNELVQSGKKLTMEIVRKSHWLAVTVVPEVY